MLDRELERIALQKDLEEDPHKNTELWLLKRILFELMTLSKKLG